MGHKNLPQVLGLLNEINNSAQHVGTLIENLIQKVRNQELATNQGLSFHEMKYNMLLCYLTNLTDLVLRKSSGERIENDLCVDRLIEIRTVLEKIKPIDHKLKYQVDKLIKTAIAGSKVDDPSTFKADPDNMLGAEVSSSEDEESSNEKKTKAGIYVPPKLSAVHYIESTSAQDRDRKLQEKSKRHSLSQAIMQDLREEYLDAPNEVSQGNRAQQMLSKEQKAIQEYEEEYMMRLPVNKSEKHRRRQLSTLGTLGEELTGFKTASKVGKRKRKQVRMKGRKIRRVK